MSKKSRPLILLFFVLGIAETANSQCNLPTTVVNISNVSSCADFMTQVNNQCPGAVTYNSTTFTYTLQNFIPQLVISGNMIVDANLTIDNCAQILMDNGASIQVNEPCGGGHLLYIENSTIRASTSNMWQGISVNTYGCSMGGYATTRIFNSTIEDAIIAIELHDGITMCQVFNTTFDKNYIGIQLLYGNDPNYSPLDVRKSRFICTSTLLAPYAGEYTTAGIVGVLLSNFTFGSSVETNPANFNVFDGIACGIFSYFCNLKVYASKFYNISQLNTTLIPITPVQEYYAGAGIYQRGLYYNWIWGTADPTAYDQFASNEVYINSPTATCHFHQCEKGIELHNTHAHVENTTMSYVDYGIIAQNCNTADLNISTNTMDAVDYGIIFSLNNGSDVTVYGNHIGMLTPYSYGVYGSTYNHIGIRVVDWPGYNAKYNITGNDISGGRIGIRVENEDNNSYTWNNTITQQFANSDPRLANTIMGIQAINCENTIIATNRVTGYTGTWNSLYHQTGIFLSSSLSTFLYCNEVESTGRGFWAQGKSPTPGNMQNNTMTDHYYGLYLSKLGGNYGQIGDQGSSTVFNGNEFNGTYTGTYKTFNETDASQNPLAVDKFWYDNAHSSMYTTNFSSSNPTGKPVQVQPILGQYTTPDPCPEHRLQGGGESSFALAGNAGTLPNNALDIAAGTNTYTEFADVNQWFDERALYNALDDAGGSSDAALQNFYAQKATESVGKFKEYNNALRALADTADTTSYWTKLAIAKQKNNAVPATHNYEQNEKDMNNIFLNNLLTNGIDRFDSTQTAQIYALAQACPFAEGKAVYLARALYSLIDPGRIFEDEAACATSRGSFKNEEDADYTVDTRREKYAFIAPNPAGSEINLFLNLDEQESGVFYVYDLLGSVVLNYTIVPDKTVQTLLLDNVNTGTYLYRVQTANGFISNGRLVIIK